MADAIDAFMADNGGTGQAATTGGPFLPGSAPNDPIEKGGVTDPTAFTESALGGAVEAGFNTVDAAKDLVGEGGGPKSETRQAIENRTATLARQSPVNALSQGISQFGVGFIGLGKVLKPLKFAGKLYDAARGAAVGAVAFDPHEARLSNLVEEFPSLQNPVTAYLSAKPDDGAAAGRFKAALENLILPGVAEVGVAGVKVGAKASVTVLTKLVDAVKLRRSGDIAGANAAVEEADAALSKAQTAEATDGGADAGGAPQVAGAPGDVPGAGPAGPVDSAGGEPQRPVPADQLGAEVGGGTPAAGEPGVEPLGASGNAPGAVAGEATPGEAPTLTAVPGAEASKPTPQVGTRVDYAPEDINKLLGKAQSDIGVILDHGSYDAAAAEGHAFAQTDLIPWQKLAASTADTGPDGGSAVRAWMEATVADQEPFIQKMRGGGAEGVLKDKTVDRMINARVTVFGEDPALLRGLILKAGDQARTMAANMESAYVIAQKGMLDTYSLAQRINAGNLAGFESEEAAKGALKARLKVTMEMFGAAKAMTAAAGRSMRRMRGDFSINADQLQKLNIDAADPDALTKLILSTQGDPKALAQLAKPGFWTQLSDTVSTLQAANLLWGWSSQVVNMGMNLFTLYQRPLTQWMGGAALRGAGAVTGSKALVANAIAARNLARKEMVTTHTFLYDAWKAASWSFLNGDSKLAPHAANEFVDATQGVPRVGVQPVEQLVNMWRQVNSIGDVAYNAFVSAMNTATVPLRVMGAADEMTKTLRYRAVVAAKADADAEVQGLKSGTQAYKDYVEQRVRDAFDQNGAAIDADALQEAKVATFSQDLLGSGTEDTVGGWKSMGALVQQGVNAVPPARMILPFVKTPTNLFRYGWRLTPGLNLLQKQYLNALQGAAGPEAQAMATGEMMLGIMLVSTGVGLRLSGRITGGGPVDYKAAKAWKDDGNMPYSIVSTNRDGTKHYVQFDRFDPVQFPLAVAADAADILMQGHLTEDQQAGLAMSIVLALSHQLKNKTYLQNVTQVLDGLTDDSKMQTLPQRLAPNFLPFSTLLQGATQMEDPILHEVHGVIDAIKARVPGMSDSVPPHRDWGGDVVKAPGKFFSDQKLSPQLAKALDEMYAATGTYMQPPSPRLSDGSDMRDIELEGGRTAYDRYVELAGNPTGKLSIKDLLGRIVDTDAYKVLPHGRMSEDGTKENMVGKAVQEFRKAGMDRLMVESKTFRDHVMQRHKDLLGQLQTNVKDLRAAQAQGAAQGLNKLLAPYGLSMPEPSSNVPAAAPPQ